MEWARLQFYTMIDGVILMLKGIHTYCNLMHITILTTLFTAVTLQLPWNLRKLPLKKFQWMIFKDVIASFDGNWQKRGYVHYMGLLLLFHMVKLFILRLYQSFVFYFAVRINRGGTTHLN